MSLDTKKFDRKLLKMQGSQLEIFAFVEKEEHKENLLAVARAVAVAVGGGEVDVHVPFPRHPITLLGAFLDAGNGDDDYKNGRSVFVVLLSLSDVLQSNMRK